MGVDILRLPHLRILLVYHYALYSNGVLIIPSAHGPCPTPLVLTMQ